jgi:hypothetical protein
MYVAGDAWLATGAGADRTAGDDARSRWYWIAKPAPTSAAKITAAMSTPRPRDRVDSMSAFRWCVASERFGGGEAPTPLRSALRVRAPDLGFFLFGIAAGCRGPIGERKRQ